MVGRRTKKLKKTSKHQFPNNAIDFFTSTLDVKLCITMKSHSMMSLIMEEERAIWPSSVAVRFSSSIASDTTGKLNIGREKRGFHLNKLVFVHYIDILKFN